MVNSHCIKAICPVVNICHANVVDDEGAVNTNFGNSDFAIKRHSVDALPAASFASNNASNHRAVPRLIGYVTILGHISA